MSTDIPLGRREDDRLEFKSAAALARPEIVGREVVAMLNAEGGEIWVGLRDEGGRAVEIERIPDPDRAAESLLDFLVERVEPTPRQDEVRVEPVALDDRQGVLRISVKPDLTRRPYALLKSGGWHFWIRIGNRIRKMTRDEVFGPSGEKPSKDEERLETAIRRVVKERGEFQESAGEVMWLRLQPVPETELDVQASIFRELLEDPARAGVRAFGYHFAHASAPPRVASGKVAWNQGDLFEVEVRADGGMLFTLVLRGLYWKGEEGEIWPLALLEYPISAFRLAGQIYRGNLQARDPVVADLALFGLRGWKLRAGSPTFGHFLSRNDAVEYPEVDPDLTFHKPLIAAYEELREQPDRYGYRLVRRVYEAFGLREDRMPHEYDRESGRLILPP